LSIHHYENPNRFADGPRRYEAFFRRAGEVIARSANPRVKIYVSEWNAQSTDWRTGLYAGGLLNAFERCGDILEIGGPALFLRHQSATGWDNAFINFDHTGWFPAPNYVVMKVWREHYAPARVRLSGDTGPLNAVATKSEDGATLYFKAVNPTERSVTVKLAVKGTAVPGMASLTLVAPGDLRARNTLEAPHAVRPATGKVSVEGGEVRFQLPTQCAGVVTIRP
jgi:alpha-N-arabinofuranosidase